VTTKEARSGKGRLVLAAASTLLVGALLCSAAEAQPPPAGDVNFSVSSLFPKYSPNIHDYVVRCNDAPVTVTVHASTGWEVSISGGSFHTGDFSEVVPLSSGRGFTVTVRDTAGTQLYRYYARCLPNDFPEYTFTRYGPVAPKYFSVDPRGSSAHYAVIFDDHGVPIWWYHGSAWDTRVLPSGKLLWNASGWGTHRLTGGLITNLGAVGHPADSHDLQFTSNGDHLVGSYVKRQHVDTSAYGGSSDADVIDAELQEVSPSGNLVWDWKSQAHISLAETGRWWSTQTQQPYDILHWNSIAPAGDSVIASFRRLDAVYKIKKSTGTIAWKLGGTKTSRSLTVKNDTFGYTFGGQHDARLLPDGTLTVFDNRTGLGQAPRAVRYRIDPQARTATLLESIRDPAVPASGCCGSARRLYNGDWLIDWGWPGATVPASGIGGYKANGERTFRLIFNSKFSYRAEPVPQDVLTRQDLRQAMNAMCSSGCG
jgi:hypothetical protein